MKKTLLNKSRPGLQVAFFSAIVDQSDCPTFSLLESWQIYFWGGWPYTGFCIWGVYRSTNVFMWGCGVTFNSKRFGFVPIVDPLSPGRGVRTSLRRSASSGQ